MTVYARATLPLYSYSYSKQYIIEAVLYSHYDHSDVVD